MESPAAPFLYSKEDKSAFNFNFTCHIFSYLVLE